MKELRQSLYLVLCLIIGVCTFSGCIEEYEADIPSEDTDLLVVEGTICSSKMNKFVLTRTQALHSMTPESFFSSVMMSTPRMVTNAIVSVRGTDGSEYMTQEHSKEIDPGFYVGGNPQDGITRESVYPATGGYYSCQLGALNPDVEYYLHIEVDGEVYESVPQKPLPTEKIAEVSAVQDTPQSNIDILVTPETPLESDEANYYSWTYDETWELRPEYMTNMVFDTKEMKPVLKTDQFPRRGWKDATGTTIMVGASTSYEGQHIRRLKLYDIDRGDERVYYRYSGLVHQRAISKAEYEYETARRQASSEMGGLFTPQPSALPTNIRCLTSKKHVIGFVGCSLNTSEYRFFIDAENFSVLIPQIRDLVWLEDCNETDCLRMVYSGMYLCIWEDNRKLGYELRTGWAFDYQLDVRLRHAGAYIEEPVFWSLKENVSY